MKMNGNVVRIAETLVVCLLLINIIYRVTGDVCDPNPCNSGTCFKQKSNGFRCVCNKGWHGDHCNIDIDECSSRSNCRNGLCTNTVGGYICVCHNGWEGPQCDKDINECARKKHACAHGQCINHPGSYSCSCNKGWAGEDCDQDVNECEKRNPCQTHGRCVNDVGSYRCVCEPGWGGKYCTIPLGLCKVEPMFLSDFDTIGRLRIEEGKQADVECYNKEPVSGLTRCVGFCFSTTVLDVARRSTTSLGYGCYASKTKSITATLRCYKHSEYVEDRVLSLTVPTECKCLGTTCRLNSPPIIAGENSFNYGSGLQ
ncbi:uncharacterized protein LOC141909832 [Tubulanus polymorphus]|uniref:uncharacterized protein LOC141909832 n=1 Tax=Tubulanus polymorphus TaxID=672921 RepID=UPI003DA3E4C2